LELLRTIEEAYYRDVLVIAAAHNEHPLTRSYPAAFAPPLLSVDKGLFADPLEFAYLLRDQVEFQAHGRGYLGPFATEPATSWAAPHLSGIAARILSLRPGLKPFEMKTILYWLCRGRRRAGSCPGLVRGRGARREPAGEWRFLRKRKPSRQLRWELSRISLYRGPQRSLCRPR